MSQFQCNILLGEIDNLSYSLIASNSQIVSDQLIDKLAEYELLNCPYNSVIGFAEFALINSIKIPSR